MIFSRKTINTTPNGSINLFQLPEEYMSGSVIVFEIKVDNSTFMQNVNELGGEYIELENIPEADSKLLILYDFNDTSIEMASQTIDGFKPWDSKRLLELTQQMILMSKTIEQLTNSLKNKISKEEINSTIGLINEKIDKLQITFGS